METKDGMFDIATIGSQGRLVIPAAIREHLGITRGTQTLVRLDGDRIVLEPPPRVAELLNRLVKGEGGEPYPDGK